MKIGIVHRRMRFKIPGGTSRGILREKDSWFISLLNGGITGIGECSTIKGLSIDEENGLREKIQLINDGLAYEEITDDFLLGAPALRFAIEVARRDLEMGGVKRLYETSFLENTGIPINGLVWMGDKKFMYDQIRDKINSGYNCIKIKIAAIDFNSEIELLKYIRSQFTASDMEIRVDANGGFTNDEALEKLKTLSDYDLHSIEQPIPQGQSEMMAKLCAYSPLDIALDEELIGVRSLEDKQRLLSEIKPQYIILKPSLLGGIQASQEWINIADGYGMKWWVTSALEANIGLNAIAQWTASLNSSMYQGLGTGQLFTNNIGSPLYIKNGYLCHGSNPWDNIFV